jgi:hypothetical protein
LTADVHVWFHEQYVTDAGAEIVDATITDKRFNSSDPEDMENFHAILCVSINLYIIFNSLVHCCI